MFEPSGISSKQPGFTFLVNVDCVVTWFGEVAVNNFSSSADVIAELLAESRLANRGGNVALEDLSGCRWSHVFFFIYIHKFLYINRSPEVW